MMVMSTVDQGNLLKMTGLQMKGTLFLVGNPTVGEQVFEKDPGSGLYLEWSKNWNALKRRDVRLSQSAAAVSLSQVCSG